MSLTHNAKDFASMIAAKRQAKADVPVEETETDPLESLLASEDPELDSELPIDLMEDEKPEPVDKRARLQAAMEKVRLRHYHSS